MNWIRPEKRLAIYVRDGLACCYCGESVEDGAKLTLDHVKAYSHGGDNAATNLVTCCHRCNSSRGNRPVRTFIRTVAAYLNHGATADSILRHVENTRRRVLDIPAAREMMTRRSGFSAVLR